MGEQMVYERCQNECTSMSVWMSVTRECWLDLYCGGDCIVLLLYCGSDCIVLLLYCAVVVIVLGCYLRLVPISLVCGVEGCGW